MVKVKPIALDLGGPRSATVTPSSSRRRSAREQSTPLWHSTFTLAWLCVMTLTALVWSVEVTASLGPIVMVQLCAEAVAAPRRPIKIAFQIAFMLFPFTFKTWEYRSAAATG